MKTKTIFLIFSSVRNLPPCKCTTAETADRFLGHAERCNMVSKIHSFPFGILPDAEFGRQIEFLDNRTVIIQGFYVPVDVEGLFSHSPKHLPTCVFSAVWEELNP
jgi:hypothetical protein